MWGLHRALLPLCLYRYLSVPSIRLSAVAVCCISPSSAGLGWAGWAVSARYHLHLQCATITSTQAPGIRRDETSHGILHSVPALISPDLQSNDAVFTMCWSLSHPTHPLLIWPGLGWAGLGAPSAVKTQNMNERLEARAYSS